MGGAWESVGTIDEGGRGGDKWKNVVGVIARELPVWG